MGNKQRAVIIPLIVLLFLPAAPGSSEAGQSSTGGTFLPLGWNARGGSLAGAASLLVRDDCAAYWNPANLVFLKTPMMTLGTTEPVPGMSDRYSILSIGTGLLDTRESAAGGPELRRFGVAFSMSHLGLDLASGSGWNEGTAGISLAYSLNHYNSVGISWRMLKSWTDLEDAGSWGTALDLGWTARLKEDVWFALVARNLASGIHYPERDESIEPSFNAAVSWEDFHDRASFELDYVLKEGEFNRLLAGTEVIIMEDLLLLQGGLDIRMVNGKRTIPHLGLSTLYGGANISLSFSFDPEDAFGRQTILSIGYSL